MLNISHDSPKWYQKETDTLITQTVKDNIRTNIEIELLNEFESQLSTVNWWQKLILQIKLWNLTEQRTELGIKKYLKTHELPQPADESLW